MGQNMAVSQFTYIPNRVIDANGISDGASLYFYLTGTTTLQSIWEDAARTTPMANPVVVDAGAPVPNVYLDPAVTYRVVTKNSASVVIEGGDIDPIVGFPASAISTTSGDTVQEVLDAVEDRLSLSVLDYGAVGDGSTNNYTAITAAVAAAVAAGKAVVFPEGTYNFGTKLEFGFANLHIIFEGQVVLKHTGTGKAVSFDGGSVANLGFYGVHFGWGNAPTLIGNVNTTDLIYVRGSFHMKLDARLRDCTTGLRVDFSVLSHFIINGSTNQGALPFKTPTNWLVVDRRTTPEATTVCKFDMCLEGSTGVGVDLIFAQHCDFWGTSEANGAGGVRIRSESINNNFHNVFCEQNGTGHHWNIEGNDNILLNCTGGGASNTGANTNNITGIRNLFLRGKFHNVTEWEYHNEWRQVSLSGTRNMNTARIMEKCHNGAGSPIPDYYPAPAITGVTLNGLWVATDIAIAAAPSFSRDAHGYVHLLGGVKNGDVGSVMAYLPAGYRPASTTYFSYVNPSAGTVGMYAVTANGGIQHVSGGNGAVILDGAYFKSVNT